MNRYRFVWGCFFFVLLLMTGCKSSQKVGKVESGGVKSPYEFFSQVEKQAFQYETLTARLHVELDLPTNRMASRVDLKMVKDSAFQLSVQPFLGIEVFRVEISVDSVKILDRMNKRYMADNYAHLKGQTPIEFNFYNLQALFTNQLFLPGEQQIVPKQYKRFRLKQQEDAMEIAVKDVMGLLYTFLADREEKIVSTTIVEPLSEYAVDWKYADFRQVEGTLFPTKMQVQLLQHESKKGGITMQFSRVQKNVPLKMDFPISSKYKRITLDQIIKSLINTNK